MSSSVPRLSPPEAPRVVPDRGLGPRAAMGWLAMVLATILTLLTAVGAVYAGAQTWDTDADIAWSLTGIVAVAAIAMWVVAIIVLQMIGWAVASVAVVLVGLTSIGVYGAIRDGDAGRPALVASFVALAAWVASLIWSQTRSRGS